MILVLLLLVDLLALPVTAALAKRRSRRVGPWILTSALLWPAAILLLLALPPAGMNLDRPEGLSIEIIENTLIAVGVGCFALLSVGAMYAAFN